MKYFTEALKIDPKNRKLNCEIYYNRGLASYNVDKFQLAYDDLTKALQLDEKYVKALSQRAKTHFKLNEFEDCIIDCEESLMLEIDEKIKKLLADAQTKVRNKPKKSKKADYEILEITETATRKEVIKAYRNLSLRYHSDKHPNATACDKKKLDRKFLELKTAYDSFLKSMNV